MIKKKSKMAQKMSQRTPQKILKGDRVSIPREALKDLRLKVGDFVLVETTNKEIRIIPANVIPRQ